MNDRLLRNLKYAVACSLFISVLITTAAAHAQPETLFLFRAPGDVSPASTVASRTMQQRHLLKLDEKGDLLIQYGKARFTVAYNAPTDQFKPSEQRYNPQRDSAATINGISLTASLSF